MTTAVAIPPSTTLQTAINREHERVERSATNMVQHAVNCGGLLIKAKDGVPHGGWATWVEEHFDGSEWTARKYMQLAREEQANRGCITGLDSIGAALKSIATPRPKQLEPAVRLDPESPAGRMLLTARGLIREPTEREPREPDYIDGEAVELPPTGVEERRWNTALRRWDDARRCMNEAVSPGLNSDSVARALQEASIGARQTAIDLEQMATAARRRAV